MQKLFDETYNKASKGYKLTKLIEIIQNENNIKLAFRNIKNNGSSDTKETDGKTNIKTNM